MAYKLLNTRKENIELKNLDDNTRANVEAIQQGEYTICCNWEEVEKLLDLLSKTFGPIPELERRAIVNCQENAMFTWKTDDECLTITIREDITNKGRPELDILIDTSTIRITNK